MMKADGSIPAYVFFVAMTLGALASPVSAQTAALVDSPTLTEEQHAFEQALRSELVCVCGTCPHLTLSTCVCPDADVMRDQLATQIAMGEDRDGIFQYFIETYGSQEPLGAPIGAFNQLAWLFPFVLGGGVLVLIGRAAVRSSRRREEHPDPAVVEPIVDAQLDARLDDELRNLD